MRNSLRAKLWPTLVTAVGAIVTFGGALLTPSSFPQAASSEDGIGTVCLTDLPDEAHTTHRLIESDGPFPFDSDGTIFYNREGSLPERAESYYHEYTVITPGDADRGARRIVTGGEDGKSTESNSKAIQAPPAPSSTARVPSPDQSPSGPGEGESDEHYYTHDHYETFDRVHHGC